MYLGICAGASTITSVSLEKNGQGFTIKNIYSKPHEGNPRDVITQLLSENNPDHFESIAVTGRRFKELINLETISEPLAVEIALKFVNKDQKTYNAIISAGGETFMVYQLDKTGKISKVFTGNKCASGTGEFFIQQTKRMGVNIDEAIEYGRDEIPHIVSGRCSVFCKSDCTHATNIGVPKGQVVAGLSQMMGNKILELLKNTPKENIMIIGGTTRIKVMMDYLKTKINNLTIPEEAIYFEALGAAIWASENKNGYDLNIDKLFSKKASQFDFHPPLAQFEDQVTFVELDRGFPQAGDTCILGLDVGSTTTKIVVLRESDLKIIASEYLRTNGDPVGASKNCYKAILDELDGTEIVIRGLGVTGSGRKIAGMHALTDGVINEIIAHAVAALHFDNEVDTIFEIGGQDAKYTYLTNGVASDYAMNEACSAGTGSFLEESAKETLNIEMTDIADWAMKGKNPPNFNDQCAAFISSDIKNTFHEGIPKSDVVAGLVYSICLNYVNRVKGARPVGKKVFMQGGVCYNKAVPIAMAALSGKEIIVPPEPGLMGSYGVALEVKNRIDQGLMEEQIFDLETLLNREVGTKPSFTCTGGKEKCDIGCSINRLVIEGKTYPFGGACNLYYNLRKKIKINAGENDLIVKRQHLVLKKYAPDLSDLPENAPRVGISRSFLTGTYFPLFAHFFKECGIRPVLADNVDQKGVDLCSAPFCYPCEIAHGYFQNLLDMELDYVFLPHILIINNENGFDNATTCPLLQGESYYLKSTFEDQLGSSGPIVLTPVLKLGPDQKDPRDGFQSLGRKLGLPKSLIKKAYQKAVNVQNEMQAEMLDMGRQALRDLEKNPDQIGVVLFGRPYSAFMPEANKGIPHKFASRGIKIIPVDFLDLKSAPIRKHMYWATGQINLKGAAIVEAHPQLFGNYITNFSCGPDSFIVGYFRDIMGTKPSLTLELDNHTADAGLETRIEAFLDIVARYRILKKELVMNKSKTNGFIQAKSRMENSKMIITTSEGEEVSLFDERVRVVFASINVFSTPGIAAAFKSLGINSHALPVMDEEDLKIGRGNSSCKECLPLQLTTGSIIQYLRNKRPENEITVFFYPTADGPCRFGQYQDFMSDLFRKQTFRNVTFLSTSSKDGYGGLGNKLTLLIWNSVIISDIFEDIYHAMIVNAKYPEKALRKLQVIWKQVLKGIEGGKEAFYTAIEKAANDLKEIEHKARLKTLPHVLIVGEIYVRKEGISRRWLPERLAESGIVSHVAPLHEWLHYVDWLVDHKHLINDNTFSKRMKTKIKNSIMVRNEKSIKNIMEKSSWYIKRLVNIDHIIDASKNYISPKLTGEAIITVGGPLAEVGKDFCGALAIGPFGCMPNRLSESILNLKMGKEHILKNRKDEMIRAIMEEVPHLPFLAIESDGNPFPQVIEARLETFIIQSFRLHNVMKKYKNSKEVA
ncbi:MAG: activase [Candidatus Marinimicrobia bacterium]|nr:activase [Candidatus Neomarinimicrobiota bacterium]